MKKFRIISALLAALMLVGSLTVFEVSAVTMVDEDTYLGKNGVEHEVINYTTQKHATDEEKLKTMDVMVENLYGYRLYADYYSGEVACTNLASGQTIFTNPYNIVRCGERFRSSTYDVLAWCGWYTNLHHYRQETEAVSIY